MELATYCLCKTVTSGQFSLFSAGKLPTWLAVIAGGATVLALLGLAVRDALPDAFSIAKPVESGLTAEVEQPQPIVIFPVSVNGTQSYLTVSQFAQVSAQALSRDLPQKSLNLEGLTITLAFSEGHTLHVHSVLDEQVSASEADLTVLEILSVIGHCTDPAMDMFFDYKGHVVESVFSDEGTLVTQIVVNKDVCAHSLAEINRS